MNIADIIVAELRKSMKSAIPRMIDILRVKIDHDDSFCKIVLEVLLKLSQEGSTSYFLTSLMNIADIVLVELRKSMESAIPWMIDILSIKSNHSLCKIVWEVLLNLSQEGSTSFFFCLSIADIVLAKLRKSMESAIPLMIDILSVEIDHDDNLCKIVVEVLLNLSQEGSTSYFLASLMTIADIVLVELRKSMESAIPWMIDILSVKIDYDDSLYKIVVEVLFNLSQEGSTSYFLHKHC